MAIRSIGGSPSPLGVQALEELLGPDGKPCAKARQPQAVVDGMGGPRASLPGQPAMPNAASTVDYDALASDLDPDVARILGRSALSEPAVIDALRSLGLETGDTLADPKTKDAIKQVQSAFGLEATGELDMEALMAILEAKMADDRRSQSSRRSSPPSVQRASPSGGGGGGGGGGMNGASGPGAPNGTNGTRGAQQSAPVDVSNYQYKAGDVTPEQLVRMSPGLSLEKAREVAPHLNNAMREAGIDTPARQAAFIAQLGHESGNFRYSEEIASGAAYEGRSDLGNTQPGDGVRFKGRGYIQLTGRANYEAAGRALGLDLVNNPELAARPENAARIAAWYWNSRGLNAKADAGDFDGITRSINGGYNGKADRDQRYQAALAAIGGGGGGGGFA